MSRTRLVALILFLGTLVVYLPASHYGFTLYDDTQYVSENAAVQGGLTWDGIRWAFTTFHASNWHPVTWLSHMLDCQLFGFDQPGMHHVVNVVLHAFNAVLLLVLLTRWIKSFWACAFVAALFAWHPLHVESVAWISERKDVLSAFFALLALLAYTGYVEKSKVQSPKSKVSFSYWLALLCFALALMSKPMMVTLPFVLLLLDYWPLQRFNASTLQRLVVEKLPFFALVAGSCVLTFIAQRRGGAVVALTNLPLPFRLENAAEAVMRYLGKIFWPQDLCIFYPLATPSSLAVLGSVLLLVLLSAGAWRLRTLCPFLVVGWLWFLGMLVPVIGLVQVGMAALADRYMYFPSIAVFLAATLGIDVLARRIQLSGKAPAIAGGAVVGLCLFLTHRQLAYWHDDVALFSRAAAVTKDNGTAHLNLGYAYQALGKKAEAMEEYRTALKIDADNAAAHNNLANLLDDAGRPDEAAAQFQEALRLDPQYTAARNNFGTLLVERGRYDEAIQQYAISERIDPADWHAPFLAGKAWLRQGRAEAAMPYLQKALRLDPNNLSILVFLAQVLASAEDPKVRDGQAAYLLAQKANVISGGGQPAMIDTLAMAYAELGRFDDAQQAAQDALEVANRFGLTNDVPRFQARLDRYKNHQPFRQSFAGEAAKTSPPK